MPSTSDHKLAGNDSVCLRQGLASTLRNSANRFALRPTLGLLATVSATLIAAPAYANCAGTTDVICTGATGPNTSEDRLTLSNNGSTLVFGGARQGTYGEAAAGLEIVSVGGIRGFFEGTGEFAGEVRGYGGRAGLAIRF